MAKSNNSNEWAPPINANKLVGERAKQDVAITRLTWNVIHRRTKPFRFIRKLESQMKLAAAAAAVE